MRSGTTRIDDGRWGATTYVHDKVDQLIEARRGAYSEVFEYDAAGSLQKALEGLDASPREAPAWEIQAGNLVKQTDKAKYAYDAFGRRIRKEVIPKGAAERPRVTEFAWDGDALAADIDNARGARCFVHEPGTLIPLLQEERGEVFTYVNDHLGMPKELIDPAGMVAWSAAHSAWGRVVETYAHPVGERNRGRKVESPFRLLGQVADEETGLCWTRFRCFDPEVGRWCSPDPLGITGGHNLFAFGGSSTGQVDPLGLSTGSPHVDRTDAKARRHILDGDATGGGHRPGTGISGKCEFPSGWSDDKIIHEISDVATDPSSNRKPGHGGRIIAEGTRDGVDIRVVLEGPARGGRIVSGFPTDVPRNP